MAKYQVNIPVSELMKVVDEWKDEALSAIADELLEETKKQAVKNGNKGFDDLTGNLRQSIEKRPGDYGGYVVGAFAPHAHLVEFGHKLTVEKGGQAVGHVPAHPFLGPAEKAVAKRTGKIIAEKVGAVRIAIRGGGK